MKILITGGAGFIGGKVKDNLEKNNSNIVIDCLDKEQNKDYVYDMSKDTWVSRLPKDYDYIVHCAAQSGGYMSLKNPLLDCDWNCRATVNLVEFAKQNCNLKKIIYTSSMAVYGNGRSKTEKSPVNPISYYAVSKLAGEEYIKLGWYHNSIPYTIFRLWNTYGGGQDLNNLSQGMLSIYLSQAIKSDVVKIKGDPSRIRDFIHVDDVVSAIKLSIENNETNNNIYNLCTGFETSTIDLIKKISTVLGKDLKIEQIDGYVGDQYHSSGLNNKLRSLGWFPTKNVDSGIQEFLNFIGYNK